MMCENAFALVMSEKKYVFKNVCVQENCEDVVLCQEDQEL